MLLVLVSQVGCHRSAAPTAAVSPCLVHAHSWLKHLLLPTCGEPSKQATRAAGKQARTEYQRAKHLAVSACSGAQQWCPGWPHSQLVELAELSQPDRQGSAVEDVVAGQVPAGQGRPGVVLSSSRKADWAVFSAA